MRLVSSCRRCKIHWPGPRSARLVSSQDSVLLPLGSVRGYPTDGHGSNANVDTAGAGATYAFISTASGNLRQTDDLWNHVWGGFATGALLGLRSKLIMTSFECFSNNISRAHISCCHWNGSFRRRCHGYRFVCRWSDLRQRHDTRRTSGLQRGAPAEIPTAFPGDGQRDWRGPR